MAIPVWTPGQVLAASDVNRWFVPAAVFKPSNTSRVSTTTLANDPDLVLPLEANAVYKMELTAYYDADTAGDLKVGWAAPAATSIVEVAMGLTIGAATGIDDQVYGGPADSSPWMAIYGGIGAGVLAGLFVAGTVTTAGTAGNLTLQWAQGTSSATATILHAKSNLYLQRIG